MEQRIGLQVFCSALGLTSGQISAALEARDDYVVRRKKKRSGGFREYVVVPPALSLVQERLRHGFDRHYRHLRRRARIVNIVQACVTGHGPLTNALRHQHGRFFYHCDLKNAFGQITEDRLRRLLDELPFDREVSEFIIQMVTFKGAIPQGASTSPVLFNWACSELDVALKKALDESLVFTRYVDDLNFSAREHAVLNGAVPTIEKIIDEHGFVVSARKTRCSRLIDGAVPITGTAVNFPMKRSKDNKSYNPWCTNPRVYEEVRLSRKKIRKYRAMLHEASLGWRSQSQVEGTLGWVRQAYRGRLPYILEEPYRKYRQAVVEGRVPKTNAK